MEKLFIPAKFDKSKGSKFSFNFRIRFKNIGLLATLQFLDCLEEIKKELEKQGKRVYIAKEKGLKRGQILGCKVKAATSLENKVEALIVVSSGKFHALSIAYKLKKEIPIIIFNPLTSKIETLNKEEIKRLKARKKAQLSKFLAASKIGILVSTKPGQEKLKLALEIKRKVEEKKGLRGKEKKRAYIFLFDTLDVSQFENFPEIGCWINTACPGLSLENPLLWIEDIGDIKKDH